MSEKYKEKYDRIYSEASPQERSESESIFSRKSPRAKLLRMTKGHFYRARREENTDDARNRINVLNRYDEREFSMSGNEGSYVEDEVYRLLWRAFCNANENFTKLKDKKKLTYLVNSRSNPSTKRHRTVFSNAVGEATKRIADRTMNEAEYTMIRDDLQGYLMQKYVESGKILNDHDERKKDLRSKLRAGTITEPEMTELLLSPMFI